MEKMMMNGSCQLCGSSNNLIKDHDIGYVCRECSEGVIKNAQEALFDNGMRKMRRTELSNRARQFEGEQWWENS
jgi:hypothetical protein